MNSFLPIRIPILFAFILSCTPTIEAQVELTGRPWIDMNYGPYLTASLEIAPGNIANKGVAIRLDQGEGGVSMGEEFVLFDTDTLRYAAGWYGPEFINWENIAFDGKHVVHADIVGHKVFTNPDTPGWANPQGHFDDLRFVGRDMNRYGPMPHDWARWKGLYTYNDKVVLAYHVGGVDVLEMPAGEGDTSNRVITRSLNIGTRPHDLVVQVAHSPDKKIKFKPFPLNRSPHRKVAVISMASAPSTGGVAFDSESVFLEVPNSRGDKKTDSDVSFYARLRTESGGPIFSYSAVDRQWQENDVAWFIRDGRQVFDMGWVGQVQGSIEVDDGQWHSLVMTYDADAGQVRFFVDGKPDPLSRTDEDEDEDDDVDLDGAGEEGEEEDNGDVELFPIAEANAGDRIARIGYACEDFPESAPTFFAGQMLRLRIYSTRLEADDVRRLRRSRNNEDLIASFNLAETVDGVVRDDSGKGYDAKVRGGSAGSKKVTTCVTVLGGPEGTEFQNSAGGDLRLLIPAGEATRLKIVFGQVESEDDLSSYVNLTRKLEGAPDLAHLTQGGSRQWSASVQTKIAAHGDTDGPLVADRFTPPMDNPYRSWMRLGGFDFFAENPSRAAVCTWQGDVWIVDGLGAEAKELTWTRIATGMFQPLGVKVVDGDVYVSCRDQITILRDLNGDGETDFYENFNNDHQVTEHFHEFAMDLQVDEAGSFYYAKSARHALDCLIPQHGTLIKVSKDGATSEILASGFRAANGVCINGDGTFYISDQEGHWTPKNEINLITPGGFYGNMMGWHEGRDSDDFLPPVVLMHNNFDRSPAEQLWVTSQRWGPLDGALLSLSYGTGQVALVMLQDVDGTKQGGVVRLPVTDFPTGVMRGRFHPEDGQLYCCGLFGWSSNKTSPGGFYRVRYTGNPLNMPLGLEATNRGMLIHFSDPLDPESATDYGNYAVTRWNYKRTKNYGSEDYSVKNGRKKGRDRVRVENVVLQDNKKTVLLEIPDMRPSMQMEIKYRIKAADGAELSDTIHNTIHKVPAA